MTKPWNSNRANKAFGSGRACLIALLLTVFAVCREAVALPYLTGKGDASMWTQSEALADRLIEERRKLDGLLGEAGKLVLTCEDFRDLQLYPPVVTRMTQSDDVEFDKAIEKLEKSVLKTREEVHALEAPLADAVFIAGEMVGESLNRDMLDLLQRDNVRRVSRLIELQKAMDRRWDEAAALLERYRKRSGIEAMPEPKQNLDADFFRVLQSTVGLSSERFYQAFHAYKDALAVRGGKKDWELMAKVDLDRLQGRMSGRAVERVRQDLAALRKRFEGKMPIGVIEFALGSSSLAGGRPLEAAQVFAAVNSDSKMFGRARLGVLQAYFAAKEDDSVATSYARYLADGTLTGERLASARYLAVQSLYALGRDSLVEKAALQSAASEPWHAKIMLVYARSLIRQKRHAEARSFLSKVAGDPRLSQKVRDEGGMALAHLNFEDRFHEAALKGYREMLDREGFQAEALYGMVWCNIRLGDLDGAEFILKKLISQHPDNVWAMEGFMVLVRKMLRKARVEWDWQEQHLRQREKLDELSLKLTAGAPGLTAESKARLAGRIDSARKVLAKNPPLSAEKIANLYQQALNLCEFLESRYRSGEYSDKTFRSDREKILGRLRLAATPFSADSVLVLDPKPDSRKLILAKLFEARSLALDIHVMHRGWLAEVLRHWQLGLRRELDSLPKDSLGLLQRHEIEKQSRRLADDIGERIASKGEDILNRITALSEDPNSANIQDWLLFQRGYLLYVREEDNLRRNMAARRWVRSAGQGALASTDEEPEVDFRAYEAPWHDMLRRYPNSQFAPAALYYLGYSMTSRGEGDRGLTHFETLATRFPQSVYAQQSLIFIGEHYFTENRLDKAEAAYDKVLDFPESRYFDQALYKLAWTRYRRNSYKSAISSFSYILEESLRKNGEKKGLLAGEALQYTALSLAEADTSGEGGWNDGMQFADRFGNAKVGAELLHKMALIYLQQNRLERAKRAMESLMKAYPTYAKIPEVLMDLAQAYDKGQEFDQGADLRERVFRAYLPGTEAYASASSAIRRQELDTLVENASAFVSRHHLFEARKIAANASGEAAVARDRHYRKALSVLEGWREAYPKDKRAAKNLYQQAEIHYALGEFHAAARKYMQVSRLDHGPLKMTAAFNAIVAAQELQRLNPLKTQGDDGGEL
jgi:TolA-binding protein